MPANRVALRSAVSATLAPVVLIGGFLVAAAMQPAGYSSTRDTISALAARGTPHRWIMTAALVALGLSHLVTASGLRSARQPGRLVLAIGGLFTIGVAVFPLPAVGSSHAHVAVAGVSFAALAIWPTFAASRSHSSWSAGSRSRGGFTRRTGLVWSVLLLILVFVFLGSPSSTVGLTERIAAGAEALFPLGCVLAARR